MRYVARYNDRGITLIFTITLVEYKIGCILKNHQGFLCLFLYYLHLNTIIIWLRGFFSIGCLRQLMTLQFCDVLHFENIFSYLIKIHFSKFKSERDTTTTDMESYPIKFQRNQSKVNSYVFQILLNFFKSSHRY